MTRTARPATRRLLRLAAVVAVVAAGRAAAADPLDDALAADTLAGALDALDGAVPEAAGTARGRAAEYLRGWILSATGRPEEAFAAFSVAASPAEAPGEGGPRDEALDAVVTGLAFAAMLDMVAYVPRETLGATDPAVVTGGGPWRLWARLLSLRYRLAAAAILDDRDGVAGALEALGRTRLPAAPRAPGAGAEAATVHGIEVDVVAARPTEFLLVPGGDERLAVRLDGMRILDADSALGGPAEHWVHVALPAGRHRLRVEATTDPGGEPAAEFDMVGPGDDAGFSRAPAEPTEVSIGAGVAATVLGDPFAANDPLTRALDRWIAAGVARQAGDTERAVGHLDALLAGAPGAAVVRLEEAGTIWESDLPAEFRRDRVRTLLESLEGSYEAALMRVALLYSEGRSDEAVSALDAVVEAYPGEPGPGLVAARLGLGRGDVVAAERSLAAAERATGRSCRFLELAGQVAERRGDSAARLALAFEARGCEPSRKALIRALLRAGRGREALDELDAAFAATGDRRYRSSWAAEIARIAPGAPDAAAVDAARLALDDAPGDARAALILLDASRALGSGQDALEAVEREFAIRNGPRPDLRILASGGEVPWPLREDGRRIVGAHEASLAAGPRDPPPVVAVLDQAVARLYADGSAVARVHRIVRLGTDDAVDHHGHIEVPAAARILTLRVVHPDGSVTPADERHGPSGFPLPGLDAGDYTEVEYVVQTGGSDESPDGVALPAFFFSSPDEWMERSEMVVIAPASLPVEADAGPHAPALQEAAAGDLVVLRWVARDTSPEPLEPWAPDAEDVLPNVRICVWCDARRAARHLGGRVERAGRVGPYLSDLVDDMRPPAGVAEPTSRALYSWVLANVRSAPSSSDTAESVFLGRSGDRTLLLLHMARLAGLEAELWYASPAARGAPPEGLWFRGDYAVPLVRLGETWLYADEDGVPFGELPPNVGGRPAVRVAPGFAEAIVPAASDEDPTEYEMRVLPDGDGRVVEVRALLRGLPAVALRQAVAESGVEGAADEVRAYALWMFGPEAAVSDLAVTDADDTDKPVSVTATMRQGGGGAAAADFAPSMLWGRRFAAMLARSQPLLLPAGVREEWTITRPAPEGTGLASTLVPAEIATQFGSFRQWVESGDGVLVLRRSARLPAQRVEPADYPAFRMFANAVDAAAEGAGATVR